MAQATLLLTLLLGMQGSIDAVFEVGIWLGEGRPVIAAAASRLTLRTSASSTATAVLTLDVEPGQRVVFDDTWVVTRKPGRLRVLRSTAIAGRPLGTTTRLSREDYYSGTSRLGSVSAAAGSDIEYLQYRAEGTCFVRVNGETIDADQCPTLDTAAFRLEAQPNVEWWVHVVPASAAEPL